MGRDDAPVVRVKGPADLLHAVPFLLGFRPVDSLVLVGLRDGRVVVTARMDLADIDAAEATHDLYRIPVFRDPDEDDLDHVDDLDEFDDRLGCGADWAEPITVAAPLGSTLVAFARAGVFEVVGIVWLSNGERPPAADLAAALPRHRLIEQLLDASRGAGLVLSDAMLVVDGRYWSYFCDDDGCCPSTGTALSDASPVAVAATVAGMTALPDRAAVEALLDPEPDRERLRALLQAEERRVVGVTLDDLLGREDRSVKRALFAAARRADEPGAGIDLADAEAVRFAVALSRVPVRDALWRAIDDTRLDGRALWRLLARRLPRPHDAAPLFLFAWASWRSGDGVLASIAAERTVQSDPGYTAADLLRAALAHGMNPATLPTLGAIRRAMRSGRAEPAVRRAARRHTTRSRRRRRQVRSQPRAG